MTDIGENKGFKNSKWDDGVANDIEGDYVFNELRGQTVPMYNVDTLGE